MPSSHILTAAMLASAAAAHNTLDLVLKNGFWFGNFTIGDSGSAMLLIDTGSTHIAVNPGVYKPSQNAVRLNTTFNATYGTIHSDGTGATAIHGENYLETVGLGTVLGHNQTIASVAVAVQSEPDDDAADDAADGRYPGDGIIGFGGLCTSDDCPDNIMSTLCKQQKLDACRFGLALNANGTGKLILGSIQTQPHRQPQLATSQALSMWHLLGDVLVGTGDDVETVDEGAPVLLDSGSSTIIGPIEVVKHIFDKSNVEYVLRSTPDGDRLDGYHACDRPPVLSFSFPSAALKLAGTPFTVPASTMALADNKNNNNNNNNNNNCTSVLSGFDQPLEHLDGAMLWVLGQPFFQGHYIDFDMRNADDPVVGIASLENDGGSHDVQSQHISDGGHAGNTPGRSAAIGVRSSTAAVVALAGVAAVVFFL